MRGKLNFSCSLLGVTRITPADAGKTGVRDGLRTGRQDHPRGCGENDSVASGKRHAMGSPPRMRGKLRFLFSQFAQFRITPADAGKTQFLMLAPRRDQDHPRGCGENDTDGDITMDMLGSPPRMRGKHFQAVFQMQTVRITPADAGKTRRVCLCLRDRAGSPPRMRGKLQSFSMFQVSYRITPADAGKTSE